MLKLLHISDLHFGPHYLPEVGRAVLRQAGEMSPDVIVASGDFTLRAKRQQYQAAREFLEQLPDVPQIVVPGNHDVPLYRIWERICYPRRNYRHYIAAEPNHTQSLDQAVIVALDSSAPRTAVVGGWLSKRQLAFASQVFAQAPDEATRIVVTHHPFAPAPDARPDPLIRGARRAIEQFAAMRVDLILGGHLHRSYVDTASNVFPDIAIKNNILIVQCGTTTSSRGRQAERGRNSLNLLQIDENSIQVTNYLFEPAEKSFVPTRAEIYPRKNDSVETAE